MSTVGDLLTEKGSSVHITTKEQTILSAAKLMNEHRIGALCVVDQGTILGMFTERDILNRVVAKQLDPGSTRVGDVMTAPVVTCGPNAKLADCAAVMSAKKIRHLPVVDEQASPPKILGMLSTGDLMAWQVRDQQDHIDHLHEYLHGRT